MMAELVHWS